MTGENGNQQALEDIRGQIDRLWAEKASAESLRYTVDALNKLTDAVESIERVVAARPAERAKERELELAAREEERTVARKERKSDRRYFITTALAVTAILVTAMAFLLPSL